MKVTKSQLRQIITEELGQLIYEQMTSFSGAGGYTYTERPDGGFDFTDAAGRAGYAKPGSAAARSIAAEMGGGVYNPTEKRFVTQQRLSLIHI